MANINATPTVFEHGGVLIIGSDTVLNVQKGTLTYSAGLWENKEYTDRGVIQDPLQGDNLPTDLSFSVKYTSTVAAGELETLLHDTGATGLRKQLSITARFHVYAGSATYKQLVFAKCVPVVCRVRAGADFDLLEAEFRSQANKPTITFV